MLQRVAGLPDGIDCLRAIGTVTGADYEQVARPLFHDARRAGRRVRLLYHFGPEFEGFTAGAVLGDARIGLQYLRLLERCAVVSDRPMVRESARLIGAMLPCPFHVFGNDEWQTAIDWLNSPATARLSHRLIRESGVLVVQPVGPLCPEDFEAVALMVDPWIESHGALQGLVVHLREFPGWEDFGAFIRHVQFVREHHLQVRRVALVADGRLAHLIPKLGEHFVRAELKHFRYDELALAIAWAGKAQVESTSSSASAAPRN
jgi:hypothetical protein